MVPVASKGVSGPVGAVIVADAIRGVLLGVGSGVGSATCSSTTNVEVSGVGVAPIIAISLFSSGVASGVAVASGKSPML